MTEKTISHLKVPESILNSWQRIVDVLAKLTNVPAAIIMRNEYPYLKALITSNTEDNPIPSDYKEKIFGTYCEVTIGNKKMHKVSNALKNPIYKNKPGLEENQLISYLGFPLEWPTGEVFGTICIVDKKERNFSKEQVDLMREFKISVNSNLELIYKNGLLKKAQERIKEQRDNLKLLTSTVRHDIANNLTYIKGFLEMKQMKSELPEEFDNQLLPYVKSSIKSIENIKKLEDLFTKKKELREIYPKNIIEDYGSNFSEEVNITGTCTVRADELLELAVKELIRNAFKHTDTPKIDITLLEDETSSRIKIQDYGSGLPQQIVESHFQNKTKQRELKGLTIVEKIMNRYNGELRYEKNEKGALFELIWYKTGKRSSSKYITQKL
jgi:K+-sensing histidine kinase KdpD